MSLEVFAVYESKLNRMPNIMMCSCCKEIKLFNEENFSTNYNNKKCKSCVSEVKKERYKNKKLGLPKKTTRRILTDIEKDYILSNYKTTSIKKMFTYLKCDYKWLNNQFNLLGIIISEKTRNKRRKHKDFKLIQN